MRDSRAALPLRNPHSMSEDFKKLDFLSSLQNFQVTAELDG